MSKGLSKIRYVYLVFAIIFLITCWEYNSSNAALASSVIPEESIRLRILANSDGPRDQWIKHEIREVIVKHMNEWVQEPGSIHEARSEVEKRLPDFERVVEDLLKKYGFHYPYTVELGEVAFPTKMYGNQIYPAGNYEALRITLGEGEGQNWWCVLFPPLCFVDLAAGDAVTEEEINNVQMAEGEGTNSALDDKEVRFFLWDILKEVMNVIKGLFN